MFLEPRVFRPGVSRGLKTPGSSLLDASGTQRFPYFLISGAVAWNVPVNGTPIGPTGM
jgi:hypothetical protein